MFRSSLLQDASATLIGPCLGLVTAIVVQLAAFVLVSPVGGGLGATSAGLSETMLAWPFASVVIVLTAQLARHRGAPGRPLSIGLGGVTGALGALLAATSIHWSS